MKTNFTYVFFRVFLLHIFCAYDSILERVRVQFIFNTYKKFPKINEIFEFLTYYP